jgi:hypothetical protein
MPLYANVSPTSCVRVYVCIMHICVEMIAQCGLSIVKGSQGILVCMHHFCCICCCFCISLAVVCACGGCSGGQCYAGVFEYFYNLFGFISEICECGPYHVIVVILVCIVAVLAGSCCYVICISETVL